MEYIDRSPRLERATKWKQPKVLKYAVYFRIILTYEMQINSFSYLPGSIREAVNCNQWRQFFQKDDLEKALSKVTVVGFSEKIVLCTWFISDVFTGYIGCLWGIKTVCCQFWLLHRLQCLGYSIWLRKGILNSSCVILVLGGMISYVGYLDRVFERRVDFNNTSKGDLWMFLPCHHHRGLFWDNHGLW